MDSPAEVEWVAERAPGIEFHCMIESRADSLAAREIAASSEGTLLTYGEVDLPAMMFTGDRATLFARSFLVLAARAAGRPPPSDGVYPLIDDPAGLRDEAVGARSLGFFGKSAIHPRQIAIINEVFAPTPKRSSGPDGSWAR